MATLPNVPGYSGFQTPSPGFTSASMYPLASYPTISSLPLPNSPWSGNIAYGAMVYPTHQPSRRVQQLQASKDHLYGAKQSHASSYNGEPGPYVPQANMVGVEAHAQVAYGCQPCGKEFTQEKAHLAHLKTHMPCSQCGFQASERILAEHQLTAHGVSERYKMTRLQRIFLFLGPWLFVRLTNCTHLWARSVRFVPFGILTLFFLTTVEKKQRKCPLGVKFV
jgi:DNA-directed RNA polymerase subunit RPC12/RpoP